MNFLSHYYFERNNPNHYMVMGVVLPDLVKNAHKDWNLNPQKHPELYENQPSWNSVLRGWNKHLQIDNHFHSSEFFKTETAKLKQLILPAVTAGPVKPFFLAHIGLELMLDHLLLHAKIINIDTFYQQLAASHTNELANFLNLAGLPDEHVFKTFLQDFIDSRYLFTYSELKNISYALNRICMRLWDKPFTTQQLDMLTLKLDDYCRELEPRFMEIFHELDVNPAISAI
jgi:acyl carrier protein phosphodiesterase